jgi:spore germination protein KA
LIGRVQHVKGAVVFIDGMAKADIINDDIIKPLLFKAVFENVETENDDSFIYYISNSVIPANEVELVDSMSSAINGFLNGDVVLFIDGMAKAMIINSKGWEKRSVTEPGSEAVVRGPRESFVENLRTNTSLIRRKIKNSALIVESMIIGRKTRTNISIAYINGVAKPELISEVKRRLKGIRTDSILESGYIEQFIENT